MENFYGKLAQALKDTHREIWVETILSGADAGKKRMYAAGAESAGESGKEEADSREENSGAGQGTPSVFYREEKGEKIRIFREKAGRTPHLVLCGGGHVSVPVIKLGKMLGFFVTVLEDRPGFADNARAAGADQAICLPFREGLARIEGDGDTWFVIVTRGHRYDTQCLESILHKRYAYVGMMGSRRRTAIVREQLLEKGYDRTVLESVHAPIGLSIHAETPEEIAVSIMAEIISIRSGKNRSEGYPEELLRELAAPDERKRVLAVMISRKGSAPRSVGTKMLIREDGTCLGTLGGGCMESEIRQKALLMMRSGRENFRICRADMTAEAAADEGMVCGGAVEVALERIC